jgi:1,4-dihydroxy-6-naphthoate synthase
MILAMKVRLGHPSDADDAYMFYALTAGKVPTGDYTFELVREGIQALNDRATRGELEASGLSVHAYAYVRDRYALARCGASFGVGCGPKIIARDPSAGEDLSAEPLAVPGTTTSAYLALQLYKPGLRTRVLPFDKIMPAVQSSVVNAALVVHEERITLEQAGLCCLVDLGQWWADKNGGAPLPLGCYAIRADIDATVRKDIEAILLASIRYAREHHNEAVAYAAAQVGQAEATARQFISLYVSDLSVDMGDSGRGAIEKFLSQGHEAGVIPNALPLNFA